MSDTSAIKSLRALVELHGCVQYADMCTAALAGESWAADRLAANLAFLAGLPAPTDRSRLAVIRTTDTRRNIEV